MSKELMKTDSSKKITDGELIQHLNNLGLLQSLTEGEKNTYLQIAKAFNLNPFKREIHVSKYNGVMSIITGYEVYIKRAERTGVLDGWNVRTEGKVEDKSLKAIIEIFRKDRQHPFIWEVDYSEYVGKTKDGHVTKFWQKAKTMIKKVAISQGFRLCFSDELGGMPYDGNELGSETVDTDYEEVPPTFENKLRNSKDLKELQEEWLKIPAEEKKSLESVKNEMKKLFESDSTENTQKPASSNGVEVDAQNL